MQEKMRTFFEKMQFQNKKRRAELNHKCLPYFFACQKNNTKKGKIDFQKPIDKRKKEGYNGIKPPEKNIVKMKI